MQRLLLLHYKFIFSFRIRLIFLAARPSTMTDDGNKQRTDPEKVGKGKKACYLGTYVERRCIFMLLWRTVDS
jgi:hypothetical protein